jgi:hypothetical protein
VGTVSGIANRRATVLVGWTNGDDEEDCPVAVDDEEEATDEFNSPALPPTAVGGRLD